MSCDLSCTFITCFSTLGDDYLHYSLVLVITQDCLQLLQSAGFSHVPDLPHLIQIHVPSRFV